MKTLLRWVCMLFLCFCQLWEPHRWKRLNAMNAIFSWCNHFTLCLLTLKHWLVSVHFFSGVLYLRDRTWMGPRWLFEVEHDWSFKYVLNIKSKLNLGFIQLNTQQRAQAQAWIKLGSLWEARTWPALLGNLTGIQFDSFNIYCTTMYSFPMYTYGKKKLFPVE